MVKDPSLWQALRVEVSQAIGRNPSNQRQEIDIQTLVSLPLLQSVYVEVLRLHVSMNVTREVMTDTIIAGYVLPKHSLVQAPSRIAHMDESTWGSTGHPASEFWAARNLKSLQVTEDDKVKRVAEFSVKGRPSDFFPFGKHGARGKIAVVLMLTVTCN
jgi:cytochrome P450